MATVEMTHANFDDIIKNNDIVLIDFWAEWCGPCKSFGPIFEAASEQHPDITFAKVDTEKEQQLAGEFGIRSIPTVAAFRDGVGVFMQPGMLPPQGMEQIISQIRELDMDQVRAELANQQSGE